MCDYFWRECGSLWRLSLKLQFVPTFVIFSTGLLLSDPKDHTNHYFICIRFFFVIPHKRVTSHHRFHHVQSWRPESNTATLPAMGWLVSFFALARKSNNVQVFVAVRTRRPNHFKFLCCWYLAKHSSTIGWNFYLPFWLRRRPWFCALSLLWIASHPFMFKRLAGASSLMRTIPTRAVNGMPLLHRPTMPK